MAQKNTKNTTQEGVYILENRNGETVRTLGWSGTTLHAVYLHDTRRIIFTDNITHLEEDKTEFTIIKTIQKEEVKNKPVSIENVGTLKYTEDVQNLTPSVPHSKDDTKPFIISLKYVGGILTGCLAFFMLISFFFSEEKQEVRIVEIIDRPETIEKIEKQIVQPPIKQVKQVVSPMTKKTTPRMAKTVTPRKAVKVTTNEMSVNQMGALAALGSLSKSKQQGGLNLDNVKTSPGIGRGGSEGSGGMQTSIYAKGLTSAPLGTGQRANGAGGYGTKGKGGGQAGYGKATLVGSAGSYFQPVKSEALVEGGLDKNEIAAVIERHIGEVRYCYEQGLQQNPRLSGRVSMKFYIGADGRVSSSNISNSSLRSSSVENCINSRLKSWQFPNPRGGVIVKVNYPFVLRRVSDS